MPICGRMEQKQMRTSLKESYRRSQVRMRKRNSCYSSSFKLLSAHKQQSGFG
jgi:hypothetical protein